MKTGAEPFLVALLFSPKMASWDPVIDLDAPVLATSERRRAGEAFSGERLVTPQTTSVVGELSPSLDV